MYNLQNKVAIVTGAGGKCGFGRAIAIRIAEEGADVVVVDKICKPNRPEDADENWKGIESVAETIKTMGRLSIPILCDITKSSEVDRMVHEVVTIFGKIDILVNNAGVKINQSILDMTDENWDLHLAVNLTGMMYCSRAVAREMVKRNKGGKIVNIGSMWGKMGSGNQDTPYCVSKFGVTGLTQCLALELARYNILVNAVCPALTDTGFNRNLFQSLANKEDISEEEVRARMHDKVAISMPLGRLGRPDDVANAVVFLLSDQANFITGQSINVSGGIITAL